MAIGLALGGGGARGMAHLGVIEVLNEAGIRFDAVSGCSVGAVVGALYCAGIFMDQFRAMAANIHWRQLVQKAKSTDKGLLNFDKMERLLVMMIGDIEFSDLEIPFGVAAMDFNTGEPIFLTEGPVARAVHASCAVPGIIEPVFLNGRYLVDGGVVDNLPVDLARELGAGYVLGIDIFSPHYKRDAGVPGIGLTVLETLIHSSGGGVHKADFVIRPDTAGSTYVRFSQRNRLISAGRRAANAALPDLATDLKTMGIVVSDVEIVS